MNVLPQLAFARTAGAQSPASVKSAPWYAEETPQRWPLPTSNAAGGGVGGRCGGCGGGGG